MSNAQTHQSTPPHLPAMPEPSNSHESPTMQHEVQTLQMTVEEAKRLLGNNTGNRRVRQDHVRALAAAMRRGEWSLNGETIKVSKSGRLLDGQHRLMAIVMADMPVQMTVIHGIDDDAFSTIDIGAKRSMGDMLGIDGESNTEKLAAVLRMVYIHRETGRPYGISTYRAPSFAQIQDLLSDDVRAAVRFAAGKKWLRSFLGEAATAWCYLRFSAAANEDEAREFFDLLTPGAGLSEVSPVLVLRNRLIADKASDKVRLDKEYKVALVFKAFKMFTSGTPCKALRIRTTGDCAEKSLFDLGEAA